MKYINGDIKTRNTVNYYLNDFELGREPIVPEYNLQSVTNPNALNWNSK